MQSVSKRFSPHHLDVNNLFPKPPDRFARQIDPHALHLRIEFQRVLAHLAAITRLLVTAKWRRGIEHIEGIDPDNARLDLLCKAVRARDVARPDAGRQAIDRFVRLLDQIVFVRKGDDGNDWAEDLFLRDAHLVFDFGKNCRLEEVPVLKIPFQLWRIAASEHGRALFAPDSHITPNAIELFLRNLWSHLGCFVEWVADRDLPRLFFEPFQEFIFDALREKQARTRAANLTLVEEDSHHGAVDCLL